jgi:hypothetical protein
MAQSIAELLVNVGVKVKDADKAQKDVAGLAKSTDKLGKSAGKSGGKLKKMGGALKTMAKGAAVAAAAVAGIGIALFKFVDAQTKALDSTAKMSRALGISAEEMQRLNFAFSQSGVSAGAGQKAILKLNEQVLKLSEGTVSRSSKAFEELGVSFKDLEGKTATEQLGIVSDALLEVDDKARRSALSATLLGKSAGPELATLIAEGSAGINALAASTENVLTGEQLQRAELFQDAMGRMDQFMTGLAQTIAVELAPPITEIIDTVREWIGQNREIIDSGVDVFMGILAQVFKNVWNETKIMIALFKPLVNLVIAIAKRVEEATGALSFFKTIITGILTPITTLTKLIKKLLEGLEKVGLVSEGTADRFESSVQRMVDSASGFDDITAGADRASEAIDDLAANIDESSARLGAENLGLPIAPGQEGAFVVGSGSPAEKAAIGRAAKERRRNLRAAKAGKSGGAGSKPKKAKKKKEKKEPAAPTGVSLEQLDRELFSGNIENVAEKIRGIAVPGSVAAAEPQVAIEFQEFKIGPITVNATGTNNEIGDAVGARIRREFDKKIAETAQRMKSKVKA